MARTPAKIRDVKFSNPDKVFFPRGHFTKGDLVKYYMDVAPWILPHLRDRPVTLIRFPDGVKGERFYEKNVPAFAPSWLETVAVARRHEPGAIKYIVIDDASALAWCANLAAIELHPFLHKTDDLARPTHVVFDFDPGEGSNLLTCIRVALLVRKMLGQLGLQSFPKVSGSKGLQLYVPLNTIVTYESTGRFAKAVAELLEQQHPELVVSRIAKIHRRRRVLIDWSQNSPAKTTVAVYSVRGKSDRPFVSAPVRWTELEKALRAGKPSALFFSPADVLKRVRRLGDLFLPVLKLKQKLPRAFGALAGKKEPPLAEYEAKRDFKLTAEPDARSTPRPAASARRRFVIQKHAASHLHYDFRLEMDRRLKSWAVPKGLPLEPGVKRAAFAVEDHPLAYLRFEGTIPQGQYGGGTVMVWDIGTYEVLEGSYDSGRLKVRLHGKKLQGDWHLFKIRSDEKKPMWLVAKSGAALAPLSARREDSSALTRRSLARIARDNDAQWQSHPR